MRALQRNTQLVTYRNVERYEAVLDAAGFTTLERRPVWSAEVTAPLNISAAVGQDAVQAFGNFTDYSRTIALCHECPFTEGSWVKFDEHEYIVVKVAESKNGTLVALREVPIGDGTRN